MQADQPNTRPHALIVGATGLSGRYAAAQFRARGWHISTLSRATPIDTVTDRHVAADLTDAEATATALAPLTDITHVFLCIWSMQASEAENVRVNRQMLVNLFAGLPHGPLRHIALVTGLKHYLGPFEAYAAGKPYTPFLESQPRLPGLNFYYDQEDVVFAEAARRNVTWSVHRPHTMIGVALGNAMNMGVTLAVYASICKATGRPFVFPGSTEQYNATIDVTDAGSGTVQHSDDRLGDRRIERIARLPIGPPVHIELPWQFGDQILRRLVLR